MYVMVEERVKEIGLRQALGATPRQILVGQLVEALLVVLFGGGLGLLASAVLLFAINQIPFDPIAKLYLGEPLLSVGTSAAIAGLLGVAAGIAGWFPARRAATVSPVEALRHE
jgi:putative ABC transport system permease protein